MTFTGRPVPWRAPSERTTQPRRIHRECRGFRNLHLIKAGASILFDPHIADCPAIVLDQDQAAAVRDTLAVGLG